VSNGEAPTSQPAPSADDPVPMDVEKSVESADEPEQEMPASEE